MGELLLVLQNKKLCVESGFRVVQPLLMKLNNTKEYSTNVVVAVAVIGFVAVVFLHCTKQTKLSQHLELDDA